jgi:hypothetical protein
MSLQFLLLGDIVAVASFSLGEDIEIEYLARS